MNGSEDHVALLGVKGGPAIRPGSNMPTSTLVSMAGRRVLVDAGLGAARGVCEQGLALTELDLVVITHLHSDHCLELGPLLHTAWTAGLNRAVPVIGPPGLHAYWDGFLASMAFDIELRKADEGRPDLAGLVEIHEITEGVIWRSGGLEIAALRNDHPPIRDSFALRFVADGRRVVLSGDTAFLASLIPFAAGADLLIHEAMLVAGVDAIVAGLGNGDARLRRHLLASHTPARDAGRIARQAGVGRLVLNHFVPDGLPGFTEADWIADVRATWDGPLTIGTDGQRIPL